MLWDIFIGDDNFRLKKTGVKVYASNARSAVDMFLKSDYGKHAPPSRVIAWKAEKKKHKNPGTPCDYCRYLHSTYTHAGTPKARRRVTARLRLHIRTMHKNPPDKHRLKVARVAVKLAMKLYHTFKVFGVPRVVINRIPAEVRPYVVDILGYNGVKIVDGNPANQKCASKTCRRKGVETILTGYGHNKYCKQHAERFKKIWR